MKLSKVLLEFGKWVYGLVMAGMLFLFFCLLLDLFSYWIASGWNPMLGQWPVFSGTVAALGYGSPATVICLLFAAAAIARLMMWDRIPGLLQLAVKHRD
jgi:hypothetical protein